MSAPAPTSNQFDSQDPYEVLGVNRSATDQDIRKAFRKLALIWHPDKYKGDNKKGAEVAFKNISQAYFIVGHEGTRKDYDAGQRDINGRPKIPESAQKTEAKVTPGAATPRTSNVAGATSSTATSTPTATAATAPTTSAAPSAQASAPLYQSTEYDTKRMRRHYVTKNFSSEELRTEQLEEILKVLGQRFPNADWNVDYERHFNRTTQAWTDGRSSTFSALFFSTVSKLYLVLEEKLRGTEGFNTSLSANASGNVLSVLSLDELMQWNKSMEDVHQTLKSNHADEKADANEPEPERRLKLRMGN